MEISVALQRDADSPWPHVGVDPAPSPSLSDGGAQSPYLTHTNGYDQDNYIEQLEHLQRRLGAGE